jgi:hypothetical protein
MSDQYIPGPDFDEHACHEEGEELYVHTVESDSPGGSCRAWVARWDNRLWVLSDSEDASGPYESLIEAVRASGMSALTPHVSHVVECEELSNEQIAALVASVQPAPHPDFPPDGVTVSINGAPFRFDAAGKFTRVLKR